MINTEKIIKDYPKAFSEFQKWASGQLTQLATLIGGDAPKETMDETTAGYVLQCNQRMLYDFFDSKEVYCVVFRSVSQGPWRISVEDKDGASFLAFVLDNGSLSRPMAEDLLFTEAFRVLNDKL